MPVLTEWDIPLTVDGVLKGQGAVPRVVRERSPRLIPIAERALSEAKQLIRPVAVIKMLDVVNFSHYTLELSDGSKIEGEFVPKHLPKAKRVCLAACTISQPITDRISEIGNDDITYAFALDGAASSAVELLGGKVRNWIEKQAESEGWTTTLPLNPGMVGWPLQDGQKQLFSILGNESDAIQLTETCLMKPIKSLSMIVGMGPDVKSIGNQCDYCTLRETCKERLLQTK